MKKQNQRMHNEYAIETQLNQKTAQWVSYDFILRALRKYTRLPFLSSCFFLSSSSSFVVLSLVPIYYSMSLCARNFVFCVYISNFLKWKCCFVSIRNNLLDGCIYNNLVVLIVANYVGYMLNIFSHVFVGSLNASFFFCFHWFLLDTMLRCCYFFFFFIPSLIRLWIFALCVFLCLDCWVCKCVFSTNCWKRSNYSFQ